VPESRLKRDVHPKAAMIEAWTGAETEVTPCLQLCRLGSKHPVNRDVIQVTRERRRDWEIRINLEENFAHARFKEHLVDIAVSLLASSMTITCSPA
jgi:hypothetical protein